MSEEIKELDWEEEIDDGDTERIEPVLFEPGDYDFTVKSFKRSKAKTSGKNMAELELEVTDGVKSTVIKDWIVLTSNTIWKIASFFRSVGLKKHGEKIRMQWKESVGRTGRCSLQQEDRVSNKGNAYKVNTIYSYLDPQDEIEEIEW